MGQEKRKEKKIEKQKTNRSDERYKKRTKNLFNIKQSISFT